MRSILVAALLLLGQLPAAAHADAATPWLPGPGAQGDDTFSGFVDAPSAGATLLPNQQVEVRGWLVDRTASGWSGIDGVQVYLGLQGQGGTLLAAGSVGIPRDDVAAALGNPAWRQSGFSVSFAESGLGVGSNTLSVYAHTPDRGWWYKQVSVQVPAPPDRGFADDPLLILRDVSPGLDVGQNVTTLTLTGYAIDRNVPVGQQVGVAGSGVSQVQVYLDGPRNGGLGAGTFLGTATLGQKNREATGFGERFLMSGFVITVHPNDFTPERHELFIYADSAYWPSETLAIVPFTVH